ncbi:MAG TPA: M24 family metallopeptidase [Thermoanaerobaculia bacterium]|nr:M24 family metallopeptidase [Thermoanaerobaculia bacterium]
MTSKPVFASTLLTLAFATAPPTLAQEGPQVFDQGRALPGPGAVLPWRERAAPVNEMLEERLRDLLPRLMREAGIDLWLVINREYAEDPVFLTLVPEPVFAARRTTMLVFHDLGTGEGGDRGVELLSVSRYPQGPPYQAAWEGGDEEAQWRGLAEVVRERDPQRIGIDVSRDWPVADGLTASLRDRLVEALGPDLSGRLVSAEELAVRWIETRTPRELEVYPHVVALARGVIAEAFSERTITPGVTTADDVAWTIRERFAELGLPIWFQPDVNLQRPGEDCAPDAPFCGASGTIRRGDVLHTDVGICYLRLCTDTQEMGYVLRAGEREAPAGLRRALAVGNRWQDLLTGSFRTGRSGNEVLAAALSASAAEGIAASVYTHPLGFFGHAPGPTIGMWDDQGPTAVRGDWPLHPSTAYAIEGNVKVAVPEWDGQLVQVKLEQSAVFDGERVVYLAGRQTEWHLVR